MSLAMYNAAKRLMDIFFSSILLVAFLPIWLVVPILIVIDSPGPVIFRHRRLGRGGKEFNMLKFRSMVENAHEMLHDKNNPLLKEFKKADWKLEHDPRITKLGKILRSITIDEFPQLLNVLKGDMSLVGPRAYMKAELEEQTLRYPETKEYVKDILSIKPGITGPWQTSGRNEVPFNVRAKLDADYAHNRSVIKDILIMLKTPAAMFSKW